MVYRCDEKMKANVYSERCKMFHAADVDGDGFLNRQEFEDFFKAVHVWQKKWGCAEREYSPEWYNMYYEAINERCDHYEGCTQKDIEKILKTFLTFFAGMEGTDTV